MKNQRQGAAETANSDVLSPATTSDVVIDQQEEPAIAGELEQ